MIAALEAWLLVRRGSFVLDAAVRLEHGEILALLGPNGSGKSTMLGALAGHIPPEAGVVTVSGRVLTRRATDAGGPPTVAVPPAERRVGLLGQDPLVFPHLSAAQNVAFGPRSNGVHKVDALREAAAWLHDVGLDGFGARKARALSGGQQQRVAIARALAARPDVLLLDEPMAALDVQTASHVRALLRERLVASGTSAIVVTHDALDAIVLADRCAILHDGRIVDEGPTARVLGEPKTAFIAALAGVNLVFGVADGRGGLLRSGGQRLVGARQSGSSIPSGAAVSAVFRPSSVHIQPAEREGAGSVNQWPATIDSLEPSAGGIRVRFRHDAEIVAELTPVTVAELGLDAGAHVRLSIDASEIAIRPVADRDADRIIGVGKSA